MNRAIRLAMPTIPTRMRMGARSIPVRIMWVRPLASTCGLNLAVEAILGTMADGEGITADGPVITAEGAGIPVAGAEGAIKRTAPNFRFCGEMYIL
jgi:hypothetical protein